MRRRMVRAAVAGAIVALTVWGWRVGARHDAGTFLHDGQHLGPHGEITYFQGTHGGVPTFADHSTGRYIRLRPGWLPLQVLLPAVASVLAVIAALTLFGRASDIRLGWRALLEEPVRIGAATLLFPVAALSTWTVGAFWRASRSHVRLDRFVYFTVLTDHRLTGFLAVVIAIAWLTILLAGPWIVDSVLRTIRYVRAVGRYADQENSADPTQREAALREIIVLSERMAERPYRTQLTLSLLIRADIGSRLGDYDDAKLTDSLLRTIAAIPRLEQPSLFSRFYPPGHAKSRFVLANALLDEFVRSDARPHLDVAIRILEGIHRRPSLLLSADQLAFLDLTLAHMLVLRHSSEPKPDGTDLDRAFGLAQQAARRVPAEASEILGRLEFHRGGDQLATLDRAIAHFRQSSTPELLALLLCERNVLSDDDADLDEAVEMARELMSDAGATPDIETNALWVLFRAFLRRPDWGDGWLAAELPGLLERADAFPEHYSMSQLAEMVRADLAMKADDVEGTIEHWERSIVITVRFASIGLSVMDRRRVLADAILPPGVIAELAVAAGRAEWAVEILELGRTVIWSQSRVLRKAAELRLPPSVAARVGRLRRELDRPGYGAITSRTDLTSNVLTPHHRVTARAALAAEWGRVAREYRLDDRPDYALLRQAAVAGPVVVVNVADSGCSAVIVLSGDDPLTVHLPDLDAEEVREWAGGLREGGMNVRGVARRLWDTAAAPLLEALSPHLGADRRVWWCPTGALSAIPLHLAGHHDREDGRAVMDHVVSSYTPSLGALLDARQRAETQARRVGHRPAVLAVSLRETRCRRNDGRDWTMLPGAEAEAHRVTTRFPDAVWLAEDGATLAGVKAALPTCDWAHFACHGDEDGLVLRDGRLGLDELSDLELDGEIAFLSACDMAVPDPLAWDEALHPAAALHVRGFSRVVAALWPTRDEDGTEVAEAFYEELRNGPGYDAGRSAFALHAAQQRLRAEYPKDPGRWAPFVHLGC
ncbi:hypothetical protein GCM10029978_042760 [Actinoallomurus acanthiterrae]